MSSSQSPCDASDGRLRAILSDVGVYRFGIADAAPVDERAAEMHERWVAEGRHGGMDYLARYADVRRDPRLLLDGAQSIISCAFSYYPSRRQEPGAPRISLYALGRDYHEVLRERLQAAAGRIREEFGGETRVCVDTAPLRERYWAWRSGLGYIGRNNLLIVPGAGSYFFLGEILTTVRFPAGEPCMMSCGNCGRCFRCCPTRALRFDGSFDARPCLSYLTIEHRGPLPAGIDLGGRLYGCDTCQNACPHNLNPPVTVIPEFEPSDSLLALTAEDASQLTPEGFSDLFSHSAIKRTKLEGLRRNALRLLRRE